MVISCSVHLKQHLAEKKKSKSNTHALLLNVNVKSNDKTGQDKTESIVYLLRKKIK